MNTPAWNNEDGFTVAYYGNLKLQVSQRVEAHRGCYDGSAVNATGQLVAYLIEDTKAAAQTKLIDRLATYDAETPPPHWEPQGSGSKTIFKGRALYVTRINQTTWFATVMQDNGYPFAAVYSTSQARARILIETQVRMQQATLTVKRTGEKLTNHVGDAANGSRVTFPDGSTTTIWSPPWNQWNEAEEDRRALQYANQLWLERGNHV
jgi:hypothetical protein